MTNKKIATVEPSVGKTHAAALMLIGAATPEDAAVLAGLPVGELLNYAELFSGDVTRRAIELRRSGAVVEARAMTALEEVTRQLEDKISSEDMHASTLAKLAETLMKLSGIAEKRAAEVKAPSQSKEQFCINIIIPGESETKMVFNHPAANIIDVEGEVLDD